MRGSVSNKQVNQVKMSQEFNQSISSEFPISELPAEGNFAERKIEGTNPLNPETAVKSKTRKPRKMSQIVAPVVAEEVAVVPAKKLSIKMKKMMMSEIPAIAKKIEMDLPQSDIGSVNQQASQMSQEFNQYGSIEMNWFNAVGEEPVVAEEVPAPVVPEVKKITTIRPRVKKSKVSVPPAPAPVAVVQDVAEILGEIVEKALFECELKEEIAREKAEKKRLTAEKAKATREANKAKKALLAPAPVVVAEEEKEDEEYEESTAKRPIQKSKEGRVLAGKVVAVEKKMKKELKVLKTPLKELLSKYKTEEKIEEKREEFIEAKKDAITAIHHAIAEEFKTSIVVARRSEAGRGEKKGEKSRPVQLKQDTIQKLFWANCARILPHFVKDFVSFAKAKEEYAKIIKNACVFGEDETISKEVKKDARIQLSILFANASVELVDETNALFLQNTSEETERLYFPELKRSILATTLSSQGVYVVKRHDHRTSNETLLVLRNSRDELIESGNPNEVMSEKDLIFHNEHQLAYLGKGTLTKICGVRWVAHEPSEE
jgi:hypothetical protein